MEPSYAKAAETLGKDSITIAKVNCDEEKDLCSSKSVSGFPTLKIVSDGQLIDYKGERTTEDIVRHLRAYSRHLVTEVDEKNFESFKTSNDVVIVAFLNNLKGSEREAIEKVAEKNRIRIAVGVSPVSSLSEKNGLKGQGILLFKSFDDPVSVYNGQLTENEVSSFITRESYRVMEEMTPANFQSYQERKMPIAFYFYTEQEKATLGPIFESVAKSYKGKINFVYLDSAKYGGYANTVNLEAKFPGFVIHDLISNAKYPLKDTLNADNISSHVKGFANGSLKPHVKSETAPANNDGPVKVIVSTEYDKIVLDKSKDVLVKFYAPCNPPFYL